MDESTWICPAYGPDGIEFGAVCFFGLSGERSCPDAVTCETSLQAERQRIWRRINRLADQGEPSSVFLRDSFSGPEDLLGGSPRD
jgi:hypothetical protein